MALLNLASRPARNERLPSLAFFVSLAILLALTAKHALLVRSLMPDRTSRLHAEAEALSSEVASLRAEEAALKGPPPDPAEVARWERMKELVDMRTLSWTRLLARLESVIPEGVRISSITPRVEKNGRISLALTAESQSQEGSFELLKRLEERESFRDIRPVSVSDVGAGTTKAYSYTMEYDPSAADGAPSKGKGAPSEPTSAGEDAQPEEGLQ